MGGISRSCRSAESDEALHDIVWSLNKEVPAGIEALMVNRWCAP